MIHSHKILFLSLFIAVVLSGGLSIAIQNNIAGDAQMELGESLRTVRDTTDQAVKSWFNGHKAAVKMWANAPEIRQSAEALLMISGSEKALITSTAQAKLRSWFQPLQQATGYQGYFIIGPDNVNLASSRDQNIGVENLLITQKKFLQKVWSGETAVSLPEESDVPLPDKNGQLREGLPTMFVGAPIFNEFGQVIAIFTFRLDPTDDFTTILQQGRIGLSGETYAFDDSGRLISNSRFDEQLREIGLIAPDERAILNVDLRDPKVNLVKGLTSDVPREQQSLTQMAELAITGQSGVDMGGYRDYRGVSVVGAWLWDSELGFGIATELDVNEAYQLLRSTKHTITSLTILVILLLVGTTTIYIIYHQRKWAEVALLRKNEQLVQHLFENVGVGVVYHDEVSKLLQPNDYFCKFIGYEPAELQQLTPLDITHPDDIAESRALLGKAANGEIDSFELDKRYIHKDGSIRWGHVNSSVIRDQNGSMIAWTGAITDITEHKLAEEALQKSEQLYRHLFENAGVGIVHHKVDGRFLRTNDYFCKFIGYQPDELEQLTPMDITHPDDIAESQALLENAANGELDSFELEKRYVCKDGSIRWGHVNSSLIRDQNGSMIIWIGAITDITELKQAEEALRESNQYNRMLFDESTIGLALCRMNGALVDINPAFASIIGRSVEETLKLTYWDITPEKYAAEEQAQLASLEKTGRYGPYEKEYIHARGHWVPVQLSGQILEKGGEKFIWSSVEDITERKQTEKVLQRSEVLEQLAIGASLKKILTALVINTEKLSPGSLCSVSLLDEGGKRLRHGAAPSLPDFYNEARDGSEFGVNIGYCEAAAYTGERVIVEDIMSHPNWESYIELAKKAGLRACWSEPVISSTGDILGTFAIHYREPRAPQQQDLDFIQDSARLAAIAIEHKQAEQALRKERDKAQRYLDTVEAIIVALDEDGNITLINRKGCEILGYKEHELLGKNWFVTCLSQPESKEVFDVFDVFNEIMAGDLEAADYYENSVFTRDGKEVFIAWHSNDLRDENGKITGVLCAGEDITERKQAEEKMLELLEQNRHLTQRLFQVQEEERRHLARELHDELGQWLTVIHINAETIKLLSGEQHLNIYDSAQVIDESVTEIHNNIRGMIHLLRPTLLDELGLIESLKDLTGQWQVQCPTIDITLTLEGKLNDFKDYLNITIYRIIQESLTNVAKHAKARDVAIQLIRQPGETEAQDSLLLTVEDNGKGMEPSLSTEGMGLHSLRERVLAAGGDFAIRSTKGEGVCIEATLPINVTFRERRRNPEMLNES
jgi:PAS domain S-box-containing protein